MGFLTSVVPLSPSACIALTFFGVCILLVSNMFADREDTGQKVFSCVGGYCSALAGARDAARF